MKKLFALFITLVLFSCSAEENGNNSVDPLIEFGRVLSVGGAVMGTVLMLTI